MRSICPQTPSSLNPLFHDPFDVFGDHKKKSKLEQQQRSHGACILRRCWGPFGGGSSDGLFRVDLGLHDGDHVGRPPVAGSDGGARAGGQDVPAIVDGQVGGGIHRDDAHRGA